MMPRATTVEDLMAIMRTSSPTASKPEHVMRAIAACIIALHEAQKGQMMTVQDLCDITVGVCANVIGNIANQLVMAGKAPPDRMSRLMLALTQEVVDGVKLASTNTALNVLVDTQQPDTDYDFRKHLSGGGHGH